MTLALENHKEIFFELKGRLRALLEIIGDNKVIYTDIPMHTNIGDLLIMHGVLKFFKEEGVDFRSISSVYSFDKKMINKGDVILLHGGGNLGDIYSLHQEFRESLINEYKSHRVVILPQTIYFESEENYKRCCKIFSRHKDLHICVRDSSSYVLAKGMSRNVYLLPDMAHQLYPINRVKTPIKNSIFIKRRDREVIENEPKIEADEVFDWEDVVGVDGRMAGRLRRRGRLLKKLHLSWFFSVPDEAWIKFSYRLVDKAVDAISDYRVVYTSRLHGHILASLMNIENSVIDNSYKKNTSYIQEWTKPSKLVSSIDQLM